MNSDKSISELRAILKAKLKSIMNTDITNISTGITARLAITGVNKISSGKAIEKSLKNDFSVEVHFDAAQDIKNLFEKSELVAIENDRNGDLNIKSIKRFIANDDILNAKNAVAIVTVKESKVDGHRIYSLELMKKNQASSRWQVGKTNGATVNQDSPTTGSSR